MRSGGKFGLDAWGADIHAGTGGVWGGFCAWISTGVRNRSAIEILKDVAERRTLIIGAGSVSESSGCGKAGRSRCRVFPGQKSGPIAGATFQEVRFGRLSGKAKEVAVSQGGTALRELVTGNEIEGHFFGFAAS
jgi:hypothetical protein